MKIKIKRLFRYQDGPRNVSKLSPGVYDVGQEISQHVADLALRFGRAEIVVEKQAPEKKIVTPPENKTRVAKPTVHRRSTRTKPNK